MNNNGSQASPLTIFAIIGALVLAVYVSSSILLSQGNQLAGLFYYVMLASGVTGLIAPRLAFSLLIIQCAYLDLFKRLMVFAGKITMDELFYVLGIAPVTVVGIAAGLMLRVIFGKTMADAGDIRRFLTAVVLNAVLAGVVFYLGGGIGGTLREVANGSAYALLLFIVPLLFRTPEAVSRCARFIIAVFIPVALYAIYQQVFGFQAFEIAYLKMNLSIEIKQLEADRVRAFSTLNSPTSISVVASSMAAMALGLAFVGKKSRKLGMAMPVAVLVTVVGVGAWAASTVRVGLLLLPVAMAGTFLFLRPSTTKWFYGTLLTGFGVLVASSAYLYQNIETWTSRLVDMWGGSTFVEQMINMNSYKDRLNGFANVLLNPDAYTLFGLPNAGLDAGILAHDPLSNALLAYGAVPLAIVIFLGSWGMWRLHTMIFRMHDATLQLLAASFLANAAGNIAVTIVNGNLLGTFPVNVFFWVSLAFAVALRHADAVQAASQPSAPKPEANASLPLVRRPPGAAPGRFAPVPRSLQ
ncbi:MAG: hypothetical protein JWO94_1279 [Verrucomicrobiaceae bacterium]|nr:hypothetical protein [Verrucomicrobiaceae bacterium]